MIHSRMANPGDNFSSNLHYYINEIISACTDLESKACHIAISNFQKYVRSQYVFMSVANEEVSFLNDLFYTVSYTQLGNPLHFVVLMNSLTKVDLGNKLAKANRISRDLPSIPPTENFDVWKLLETILIWLSKLLGSSLHLILQPLRDHIWSFCTQNNAGLFSSLCLLDIFLKKFPSSLNANFEILQSLLLRTIQNPSPTIYKMSIRVLRSAISLTNTPYAPHINPLFISLSNQLRAQQNNISLQTIDALFHTCKKYPEFAKLIHFTELPIGTLATSQVTQKILPLIYICSPEVFKKEHVKTLFQIYEALIIQYPERRKQLFVTLGDLSFLIGNSLHSEHEESVKRLYQFIINNNDCDEAAYAILSLMSPLYPQYQSVMQTIISKELSGLVIEGLNKFIQKWPLKTSWQKKYVLSILIIMTMDKATPEHQIIGYKFLRIFKFVHKEISEKLILQLSIGLNNSNYKIKLNCAKLMLSLQNQFPSIQIRLIGFASTERSEALRLYIIQRIVTTESSTFLINPLFSLCNDSQNTVGSTAMKLLCKIPSARLQISQYIAEIIRYLENGNLANFKYFIILLSIIVEDHSNLILPYGAFLIKRILDTSLLSSSSMMLLSKLIPISKDIDLSLLVQHLLYSLRTHSTVKRLSASLTLLLVAIKYTNLRTKITNEYSNLTARLIELAGNSEDAQVLNKLYDVFVEIGSIKIKKVNSLFSKTMINEKLYTFTGITFVSNLGSNQLNSLVNTSISISLSIILDIMNDDSLFSLLSQAFESLITILKNIPSMNENLEEIIISKIFLISKNSMPIIIHNIPTLMIIFGTKMKPLIPSVLDYISLNWGKIDTAYFLRAIDWICLTVNDVFKLHIQNVTSLLMSNLSLFHNDIVNDIMSTISSFGSLLKSVDYLVIPPLLSWIETHVESTAIAEEALFKLRSILTNCDCSKYCSEILRTLELMVTENPCYFEKAVSILNIIAYQMRENFFIYLPEIYLVFNLENETEFNQLIQTISTQDEYPEQINKKFGPKIDIKQSRKNTLQMKQLTFNADKTCPAFKQPKADWESYEWNNWCDEIVPIFLSTSPSKAITACSPLSERDVNVRNSLFPVAFALCEVVYSGGSDAIDKVFKTVFKAENVPNSVLRLFISAYEYLEVVEYKIGVDWNVLAEKALQTNQYHQSLRFYEHVFQTSPEKAIEHLVFLNQTLGLQLSASGILRYAEIHGITDFQASLATRLGNWEDSLKFYESKLEINPNNNIYLNNKKQVLQNLCRFKDLYDITNNEISIFSATSSFHLSKMEKFETIITKLDEDTDEVQYLKCIYHTYKGNYDEARKYIKLLREKYYLELFPTILDDYERAFPYLCYATNIKDIEDVISIKTLEKRLKSPIPYEKSIVQAEINRIITAWEVKFNELSDSPIAMFDSLLIKELVLSKEMIQNYWLIFLNKIAKFGTSQLTQIAIERLKELGVDFSFALCKIKLNDGNLPEAIKSLEKLVGKQPELNATLSKWEYENGNIEKAIQAYKNIIVNSTTDPNMWLFWSKLHLTCFEKTNNSIYLSTSFEAVLNGLKLSPKDSLPYALRAITIMFQHGSQKIYDILLKEMNSIDTKVWINLLPQIIARLECEDPLLKKAVHSLILLIGKCHPQAVLYSLIVPYKSESVSKQQAAASLIDQLKSTFPSLVSASLTLSDELLRIAQTWHEEWFQAIDEASREYVLRKNPAKTIELLMPLHKKIQRQPQTMFEVLFLSNYSSLLSVSQQWLEEYQKTGEEFAYNQAWNNYVTVFKDIRVLLNELFSLNLQDMSPLLFNLNKTDLLVPGYNYKKPVTINRFSPSILVIHSKQRPRKLTILGNDGNEYTFLLKPNEDTRLDERVMQLFNIVSNLLDSTLRIKTYPVLPITAKVGLIGWISNCMTVFELIKQERIKTGIPINEELKEIPKNYKTYEEIPPNQKFEIFQKMIKSTPADEIKTFLLQSSGNANDWLQRRVKYTGSLAVTSIATYVLGLGDRHLQNIMILNHNAQLVHIDYGDCFDVLRRRKNFPETVPFRLTRILTNALEVSGVEGSYRSHCENVMNVMRDNNELVLGLLETFICDPLLHCDSIFGSTFEIIDKIKDKLSGKDFEKNCSLTVNEQVDRLIKEATNIENLSKMFSGWCPWW